MKKSHILCCILALLFGIFMLVYGGYGDNPGAQLLGVLLFVGGIIGFVQGRKL